MKRFFVIVFILLIANVTQAQRTKASVSADTMRMLIGDQTKLRLQADHNPNKSVVYPELSQQNLAGLMVLDIGSIDTLRKLPTVITEQAVTVAAYDSGYYKIKSLPFKVYFNGNLQETAYSKPIEIVVSTMVVDTNYVAAIKPIHDVPYTFSEMVPYLIGILFFFLLGFLLYRIRNSKEEPVEQPEIIIPAHEIANTKLFKLKEEKLWQQGKIKEYHSQVTYIVREYLENRFNVNALEYTTEETITALKSKDFDNSFKNKLREILERADLVKFAKDKPGPEVHEEALTVAKDFVQQTKKVIDLSVENALTNETEPIKESGVLPVEKPGTAPIKESNVPVEESAELQPVIVSDAKRFTNAFNKIVNGALDYSVDSLKVVDEILEDHHQNQDKIDQTKKDNIITVAGSYIFEVARRNYGGEYYWFEEMNQPVLVTGEPDFRISIIAFDKVKMRIENGKDDQIPWYFKGYEDRVKNGKPGDEQIIN